MKPPIRIANCSGFYGDRLSAAREMVDGGPIDVLSGDWLAELTMLILARNRLRDPSAGYARTFIAQMDDVLGDCLDRGVKVVANAGGLAPAACAEAVRAVAARLGRRVRVATVAGDDLAGRLGELRAGGVDLANLDTGEALGDRRVLTANAYLGGWGIADALARGADVVVTGRVTDAALVIGPAAWHHAWARDDWDALAGACVAGHVVECGAQATGGNYAFFTDVPGLEHPGFPIAEVAADGSSVITKHPAHGGCVSVGTVTAQLLYEIAAPAYPNPDVTARFDTITLTQEAPDRVAVSGVRGEPPPPTTKVALNYHGGYRTTVSVMLTGLDIEAKAALVERSLWAAVPGGRGVFSSTEAVLLRTDQPDPPSGEAAMAELRITVRHPEEGGVGRALTGPLTELALASIPGFFTRPPVTSSYGVYWPASVPSALVPSVVDVEGEAGTVPATAAASPAGPAPAPAPTAAPAPLPAGAAVVEVPLGRVAGARSGDKGGNANVGVWVATDAAYAWLAGTLTVERIKRLLPETAPLRVERHELPNLRALNFVVAGLLGEGVASSSRVDPQAKSLGEYLRAKVVEVPAELLG